MLVPIRCFTCGKPVAQDWDEYVRRCENGESPKDVLDDLGYTRYCCRRILLSTVDVMSEVSQYKIF